MSNMKNVKLLYCILGSFILILLQSSFIFKATYGIFGGGSGANAFTELIYRLFALLSFIGVILLVVFSCILIISNINIKNK